MNTKNMPQALEDRLTIEQIKKEWEKAKKKRNGGSSGLAKVIEYFDEFMRKIP